MYVTGRTEPIRTRPTDCAAERRQACGAQAQACANFAGGDASASDEEIARTVGVGGSTVYRTKRHFVEGTLGGGGPA